MQNLAGKVVIVTGASRGIGAAAAIALGAAGASVMLIVRDAARTADIARQITASGGKAEAMACDVSDYAACQAMVEATSRRFGAVDVLVNNAGVIEPINAVGTTDPEQWARSIQVNLIGAYNAIRAVLQGMLARGHGDLINVSSGAALRPQEGWSAYCAGKAARLGQRPTRAHRPRVDGAPPRGNTQGL